MSDRRSDCGADSVSDISPRAEVVEGIFRGMPSEQYFRMRGLSYSGAKSLLQSPAHYKYRSRNPRPSSPAQVFGQVVHSGVLEPMTLATRVACAPICDKRTKAGKETWADFESSNFDKLILAADDHARAVGTINAVLSHPAASALLAGAESEVSLFWHCKHWQIPRKARLDTLAGSLILDLKTCRDASPQAFARDAANYGYHMQAANYVEGFRATHGAEPEGYLFIAVESEPPHGCAVYSLPWEAIEAGAAIMDRACEIYRDCSESNIWPSYSSLIEPLTLPSWALGSGR